MVTTERLWSLSRDQSSRETPSTRMASTIACTLLRSLPSEKLGTHSMTVSFIRLQRFHTTTLPLGRESTDFDTHSRGIPPLNPSLLYFHQV